MNILVEQNYIAEMECGTNFSYILNDETSFMPTEYKVLQSQKGHGFVKCMKMLYNGKIQIFYLTKSMKPLSAILPNLDAESFLTVISNLLTNIIDVKHNGFLSCQNVDISFDKIFIDPITYSVSLVYLPTHHRFFEDDVAFENALHGIFMEAFSDYPELESPKGLRLLRALPEGTLSAHDLQLEMTSEKFTQEEVEEPPLEEIFAGPILSLVAMNGPAYLEVKVTKDEFVIGKKAEIVDGVISFNPMISRLHCKVQRQDNEFIITDLQSANGTYVNKKKLQPHQPHPIQNGDIVRLANSDFKVTVV